MDIFLCEVRQVTQVLIIEQAPQRLAESLPFVELLFVTKNHSMYMYYSHIHTAAGCGFGIWLLVGFSVLRVGNLEFSVFGLVLGVRV